MTTPPVKLTPAITIPKGYVEVSSPRELGDDYLSMTNYTRKQKLCTDGDLKLSTEALGWDLKEDDIHGITFLKRYYGSWRVGKFPTNDELVDSTTGMEYIMKLIGHKFGDLSGREITKVVPAYLTTKEFKEIFIAGHQNVQ